MYTLANPGDRCRAAAKIGSTSVAIADSPRPSARYTRRSTGLSGRSRSSRGSTWSCIMRFISRGTPGMQATKHRRDPPTAVSCSANPGAVPIGLARTSAPRGRSACLRLLSVIGRPNLANKAAIAASAAALRSRPTPAAMATASAVRSSEVGPSPPDTKQRSACAAASCKAATISSTRSRTEIARRTVTPSRRQRSPR